MGNANLDELFFVLEESLPEGWVWEAGNRLDNIDHTHWAQAISPEFGGLHSNLWGTGNSLTMAILDLIEKVQGWVKV